MMRIEDPTRFVRELKGAPLSIVILLSLTRQAMTNQLLVGGTGYSDKTVAAGLDYLLQVGMVVRASGGWRIAEGVQLVLPMGPEEITAKTPRSAKSAETLSDDTALEENSDDSCQGRKISAFDPLVVSSINSINNNIDLTTTNYLEAAETENFRLNLQAMREVGIVRTPKTEALARKSGVDALYILAMAEQVKREGQRPGLAIWRMEKGFERTLWRKGNGHWEGCECNACKYDLEGLGVMSQEEEWVWYLGVPVEGVEEAESGGFYQN